MNIDPEIIERCALGVTLLDEVRPNWPDLVDPDRIDLWSPQFCVLGQAFAADFPEAEDNSRYATGARLLGSPEVHTDAGLAWGIAHGFHIDHAAGGDDEQARMLREHWSHLRALRRMVRTADDPVIPD